MKKIILALLILIGLCGPTAAQPVPQCAAQDGQNGSRLCVTLGFKDGKLVVDRSQSVLSASPLFTRRLSGATIEQVKASYFDQLDQALAGQAKPYQLALAPGEGAPGTAGEPNDELTAKLRTFSKGFQEYLEAFMAWTDAVQGRKSFGDIFGPNALDQGGLYFPLTVIDIKTPLIFNDTDTDLPTAAFTFTVIDPIDWSDVSQVDIRLPDVAEGAKKEARLKRLREKLKPLSGQLWNPPAIRSRLMAYYRQLGLKPTVTFPGISEGLEVIIIEAPRVVRIILPPKANDHADEYNTAIDKILYVLMSDKDFRTFLKKRATITTMPTINYKENELGDGPYLDATRVQVQQLLLSQINYVASVDSVEGGPDQQNYAFIVKKIADTQTTPPDTPKEAPPTANESGVVTAHQQEAASQTAFAPKDKPAGEPLKEKKNYIGGGLEYRPGQGVRFFGLGQRSQLRFPFQNGSISAQGGGVTEGGGIGSFNYFADYVGFGLLHRRLSLQATFSSDLDANRKLDGQTMDERRTSGMARVEFEPFRDKAGSLLRFYAEGRQAIVTLKEMNQPDVKQHLTTLDVGSLFTFESIISENPRRLRLEPRLRFGLGLADGSPSFTKLTLTGNFHQTLPHRLAADISGNLGLASQDTPEFELPSFGGAETVRGFRHDDALGRRLWSLQNELWLPLPRTATDDEEGLKVFLRDNVRLAPFVDVGGLYSPSTSKAGVRSGYGMGLRVIYNIVIFNVDYAYGVGAAATGGSRGKFYFTVKTNLPF